MRRVLAALLAFAACACNVPMPVRAQMTSAAPTVRFMQLYRLRSLAAASVATILRRSFANIAVTVVPEVNALQVTATAADHRRIAEALAQLDAPTPGAAPSPTPAAPAPVAGGGPLAVDVVSLRAAIPGANGGPSSTASDIANAVMQTLGTTLPDLRVTVYAGGSQLLLTGNPASIRAARDLIEKLDTLPKMVVLDVTILEVDESVSKNLGLSLTPAVISTTYSEVVPQSPNGGPAPPLLGLQQLTRTPLSLGLTLNLLVQNGRAKVLADPKLTTLSGRTASIRAGDNLAILTTTGGSVGTVATTQLVTFNTGVQLDVTPVINVDDFISVTVHPTINNLASIANGVPQISTRDTQTTVALREGQTLVIGGLIEDTINRTEQRVPVLGDLPLVGKIFRNTTVNGTRNELIITVTPHVVNPLSAAPATGPSMTDLPTPVPLPAAASGAIAPPPLNVPVPATAPTIAPAPPSTVPATFVFGRRPGAIPIAGPNDPARIFYVRADPTAVRNGTPVTIEAVTSTNVARVVVQLGATSLALQGGSPGNWSATVPFASAGAVQAPTPLKATLTAIRTDGTAVTLDLPFTILP